MTDHHAVTTNNLAPGGQPVPPLQAGEKRVIQYGRQWIEHVSQGGAVRNGNILVGADE